VADPGKTLKESLRAQAAALGFVETRITSADAVPGAGEALAQFLDQGRHGDMVWMATTAERRAAPQGLWPDARSVIMLAANYGPGHDPLPLLDQKDRGYISVYARGADYHDILKKRLRQLATWLVATHGGEVKLFVDTAPVMEKPLAMRAGLGWQGRHTNLVSRRFGSWLFLGCLFTSLDIPADDPESDHCGSCHDCEPACPTGALNDGKIDPRLCIAYLTVEHKGSIAADLRPLIGNRIFGCDDCLAVCPWNKFAQTGETVHRARAENLAPRLADLALLDDQTFRALYAGSPIKRLGWVRFLRNVLIGIGNSGLSSLAPTAIARLDEPEPLVRGMAVWAARRLLPADQFSALATARRDTEQDPTVKVEWD
jgi:epoxyqueuosine reductase